MKGITERKKDFYIEKPFKQYSRILTYHYV